MAREDATGIPPCDYPVVEPLWWPCQTVPSHVPVEPGLVQTVLVFCSTLLLRGSRMPFNTRHVHM
jgi:hypothetical protein